MTQAQPEISVLDDDTYGDGDPTTFGLPLDQYDYLRDHEPCYLQRFDNPMLIEEVWVVTRHADVFAIDRDRETWAADRGYVNCWKFAFIDPIIAGGKPSMLTLDGDDHQRNRTVISRGFTPNRVLQLEEKFRAYAKQVIDEALDKRSFNFVKQIAQTMPIEALGDVLGVPESDRAKFFGWIDTYAAPFDPRMNTSITDVMDATDALMAYALELRDLRRDEPGDDVMSQIAAGESGEILSEDEVMGNISLLAAGAAESTSNALSHGIHELMRNPAQMAWIRDRAHDIPSTAVQELIRITSPFTHLVRTATRDVELHGKVVKEGERVAMLFAAANFDPRAFDRPREFDLARDPNPHLSFGKGAHACLGRHVAALEIKILLEELLTRTRSIEQTGDISYVRDAYSRAVYDLPVEITPA